MSIWIIESGYIHDDDSEISLVPDVQSENGDGHVAHSKLGTKKSITKAVPKWIDEFRERVLNLSQQVQGLKIQTALAKWEGNIRGAWPFEEYNRMVQVEEEMIAALAQVCGSLLVIDAPMC